MKIAEGVCVRRNLMTMSRPKDETKSVSEDIQVLQPNLHRGSLTSIDREQCSKAEIAPAIFKMEPVAATRNRAITVISS
jgi:hypothetical protein